MFGRGKKPSSGFASPWLLLSTLSMGNKTVQSISVKGSKLEEMELH